MDKELLKTYHLSRKNFLIIVNYYDTVTNKYILFVLIKDLDKYINVRNIKNVKQLLETKYLNKEENVLMNSIISRKILPSSKLVFLKNTSINYETTLIDTKKIIAGILSDGLNRVILDEQLYLEEWNNRKPMENYLSGNKQLEIDVSKFNVEKSESETIYIDDILLKNIHIENNILGINVYDIVKYISKIKESRDDLLEKKEELIKYLKKYWLKMNDSEINQIIRTNEFTEDYLEEKKELLDDFYKLSKQEGDFNEILFQLNIEEDSLPKQEVIFNGFILENKENQLENKKLDLYSLFKYFELNEQVPFSRYSYGNQITQKMVKIFENFYSIEHIKFLEQWNKTNSYKETPPNCVQWMGFYDLGDRQLLYEIIFFLDGVYQIRLYQQQINLEQITNLLEYLRNTILSKVKEILHNIGIEFILDPYVLGSNIYFVFSKLEINLELNEDVIIPRLQKTLNKSIYLFNKTTNIVSNEFVNLEFKKVNNYTRSDQILKYITHYVMNGRLNPRMDDMTPLVKQIMTKYKKNTQESLEIVNFWISKFISIDEQQVKKTRISKNIGLEVVGKQVGSNSIRFYMSNVTELEDIHTFFYYITLIIYISQLTENNNLFLELIGKKQDEKLLNKVDIQKEQEQIQEEQEFIFDASDLLEELEKDEEYGEMEGDEDLLDLIMGVQSTSPKEKIPELEENAIKEVPAIKEIYEDEKEDEDEELVINGTNYYIRRLQQMDKELYDYKVDSKFKLYSKQAMPNDSRQPISLTNKQMNKIKEKYGDDTDVYGGIHRDLDVYTSYKQPSYSIKHRNLHYICPKVWCMRCQLPYYMDSLINAEIGYNDKGEYLLNPNVVKCPDCGGGVWDKSKRPDGTLLIAQDNLKRQPYPGFFPKDKHPGNLCMVACFKRPNQKIEECQGDAPPIKKITKSSNEKTILKGDKYGICSYDRYCQLPKVLHNWLNMDYGNSKLSTKIIDGFTSILRRGILEQNDDYYHSFENTFKYLLGEKVSKLDRKKFRKYLVKFLQKKHNILDLFRKCRKGSFYLYFDKNIENYYQYLLNTVSLQPKFIIPLFSLPGVLHENGSNFYVLKEEDKKIFLECEYLYSNINENGLNLFIYTHSLGDVFKKNYYEPIIIVKQTTGNTNISRTITNMRILGDLWNYVKKSCKEMEDPWISEIKRSKNLENDYFINKDSSKTIIENILLKSNEFMIMSQFVNEYNQTDALIIKWVSQNKNYILPIEPTQIQDDIIIIDNKEFVHLHDISSTIEFLNKISDTYNILYTPSYYTKNENNLITGIYTISGHWVPVTYKDVNTIKDELVNLDEWKHEKDDWILNIKSLDERTMNKKIVDTKKYNYEKLRYELSGLVNKDSKLKDEILEFMRMYKRYLPIEEKNKIKSDLIKNLSDYLRTHLVVPGLIGEWNMKDIFKYCRNNETLLECNNSSMCNWKDNTCKFVVNPEWYWKYISKIADELLVNINKKHEIINEYRKELEIPKDEVIFYSKQEIDDYLSKYDYNLENKKFLYYPLEHFNYSNPKKILTEDYLQKVKVDKLYKIPIYIKNILISPVNPNYSNLIKNIKIHIPKESNNNYFFSNLEFILKKLGKNISIRSSISNIIRKYPNSLEILDKYKSISEMNDVYKKFRVFKTTEALADYVNEYSWGSHIDLELISRPLFKFNIRFIIIEDLGSHNLKDVFVHLPNQLENLDLENTKFIVFIKHGFIYDLVIYKDNPIINYKDLDFINVWLESQEKFEKKL